MLAHFAHIEAWYAHVLKRTSLSMREVRHADTLRYEYRRLSDCPAVVALYLKNIGAA